MFLGHLLTFEDRQKLLKLAGWKLIEIAPKYMESSKSVCAVRHVRTKYGAREQHVDVLFPRIRANTVLRLYRNFRRGQRGVILEQLSILFHLGLGVPKHKQVAEFIEKFEQAEDQKVAIKYIGKMIKQYIANYAFSMDDHEFMYCAAYTEQLLTMQKFIAKSKATSKNKSMAVPEGRPAVMVYSLTDYAGSKFNLVDGYAFSDSGFPIPISASVLRKEFTAVPRSLSAYSLRKHGQYVLVFGMLYWPKKDGEEQFKHMQYLGTDEYEVLIDEYDKYSSKEMLALRQTLTVEPELHAHHKSTVDKLSLKEVLTEKERLLLRTSKRYFAERRKVEREIRNHESDAVEALVTNGPVGAAKFFALDIAIMGASRKLRTMTGTKPEALASSLNTWGFTTALVENPKIMSRRIPFIEKSNRRSWQIDMEKKS
jgi:hypothetical protein